MSPCMPAPRAHVFQHMCAWCMYTRGHFERTHGDVLNGHTTPPQHHDNAHAHTPHTPHALPHTTQHSSPKIAHVSQQRASEVHQRKHWFLHIFQFENRSRTTCCRFLQSLTFSAAHGNHIVSIPFETIKKKHTERRGRLRPQVSSPDTHPPPPHDVQFACLSPSFLISVIPMLFLCFLYLPDTIEQFKT